MSAEVVVEDLVHRWPSTGSRALDGVSLRIAGGERVALVGPNGAGKSTLLAYLNGTFLANPPVRVGGVPVDRAHLAEVRRRVGVVQQETDDQLFMPTVEEDVAFGPLNAGLPVHEVRRRVDRALEQVGARGLADRAHGTLSGGERRRVAIASVLSMDVEVLVVDEPTANLDARGRREIAAVLAAMPQTLIVATHDLALAEAVCGRVVVVDGGRVVEDGDAQRVLSNRPLLERHGVL